MTRSAGQRSQGPATHRPAGKSAIPILIGALNHRFKIMGPGAITIPPKPLPRFWFFEAEAKAAIPALIEMIRTRENEHQNGPLYRAVILALGQIGPEAKAAIPILQNLMTEYGEESRYHPELVVALYQLAPDGRDSAEQWLKQVVSNQGHREMRLNLEARARVIAAMGRTSFETDWLTRRYLEELEDMPAYNDQNWIGILDGWFENVGRLGSGARLAIPRLNEFRKHPSPWVRMWAAEALEQIVKAPPVMAD